MKREYTVAQELSGIVGAIRRCQKEDSPNLHKDWAKKHREVIRWMEVQFLPHGSGFDSGTTIDIDKSVEDQLLVFNTSFHHMDENGSYDGWTDHEVVVRPTFAGFNIKIGGKNYDDIKDHIHEAFSMAMSQVCHLIDGDTNTWGWYHTGEDGLAKWMSYNPHKVGRNSDEKGGNR